MYLMLFFSELKDLDLIHIFAQNWCDSDRLCFDVSLFDVIFLMTKQDVTRLSHMEIDLI